MIRRRAMALAVIAGLIVPLSVPAGATAQATPQATQATRPAAAADPIPLYCLGSPTKPFKTTHHHVRTSVRNDCSWDSILLLQRRHPQGSGFSTVTSKQIPGGGAFRYLDWYCAGKGTYYYRSVHEDDFGNRRISAESRITC